MQHLSTKISSTTRFAEILAMAGAMWLAWMIHPNGDPAALAGAVLLGSILYTFAAELTGAYADLRLRPFVIEARRVLGAWVLTLLCILTVSWAMKLTGTYSRLQVGLWAIFGALLLVSARWTLRSVISAHRRNGRNQRQAVLIGAGALARQWIRTMRAYPDIGLRPVAAFDDNPKLASQDCEGVPILGPCDRAVEYVNANHIPMVFITLPLKAENRLGHILDQFLDSPANLYIIPDVFTFQLMNLSAFQVADIPIIAVSTSPLTNRKEILKRAEDIILGFLALVLASPLMLFIALAIKLDSAGPVFFSQWRYGLDGREMRVWKFRTMRVIEDGRDFTQATRNDSRVTRIGFILRRTSLDELPQLFNVIAGSMSLVGPRPHAVAHDEEFRSLLPRYMWRLKIKPGITGWAQVNGWRGQTDTLEKMRGRVEHDLHYIENWTISLDMKILWLTIWRGFVNENAF